MSDVSGRVIGMRKAWWVNGKARAMSVIVLFSFLSIRALLLLSGEATTTMTPRPLAGLFFPNFALQTRVPYERIVVVAFTPGTTQAVR